MSKSINFLKKQVKQFEVKQKRFFYVKIALVMSLLTYLFIMIGLVIYSMALDKQKTKFQAQMAEIRQSVDSLRSVEAKQILLKNKTASLTEILSSQKQHQRLIETIFQLIPAGVMIGGLNINQSGTVGFSARTQDLKLLTDFLNNLVTYASEPSNQLNNITVENVIFSLQGGYAANINLFFTEDKND